MVILVVNWQFVQFNAWDSSGRTCVLPIYVEYVSIGDGRFVEVFSYVNG